MYLDLMTYPVSILNMNIEHPLVVVQLCSLFHIMVIYGLVPDHFGNGIINPPGKGQEL